LHKNSCYLFAGEGTDKQLAKWGKLTITKSPGCIQKTLSQIAESFDVSLINLRCYATLVHKLYGSSSSF